MSHATPHCRKTGRLLLARCVVDQGWPVVGRARPACAGHGWTSQCGTSYWMPGVAAVCHTRPMTAEALLDRDAIGRACQRFGVARLRVFGSAVTGHFDPESSDFDFLVDFGPQVVDLLGNYLGLKAALERITGRRVDLVMTDAVENPYVAAEASRSAQELYAA